MRMRSRSSHYLASAALVAVWFGAAPAPACAWSGGGVAPPRAAQTGPLLSSIAGIRSGMSRTSVRESSPSCPPRRSSCFSPRIPRLSAAVEGGESAAPDEEGAGKNAAAAAASASNSHSTSKPAILEGFGKGIVRDIRKKAPYYRSDIKDGLNIKTLSAVFFMFFSCLAPAVAFGGLLSLSTAGQMGSVEMITATAGCGVAYSIFAGQPLTIIGSTGPVLAFIIVLFKLAQQLALPFLPLYAWTGLWTALFLGLSSVFSLSNMVEYFTRFTDEIFSLLIASIFVFEALKDLVGLYSNPTVPFVKALLSSGVAALVYGLSRRLNAFRRTPYLNKPVREIVSDFAPTIGMATGVGASLMAAAKVGVTLPTLAIPASFGTSTGRPWLVNLLDLPVWARWASAVPALMSFILLFMDQNITVRVVNSSQHKLKKGYGMNLDMAVISVLTAVSSLFGLPWLVAATVRSFAHVKALGEYEQKEGKEELVAVKEQRLSALLVHALIGVSILLCRPLLAKIPLAALMGLFLYLGVGGLKGIEMVERIKLLLVDPKLRPNVPWVTQVDIKKTHAFTGIQVACLMSMIWLKGSPVGVFFPVIIALLAPLRFLLQGKGLFTEKELQVLDAE